MQENVKKKKKSRGTEVETDINSLNQYERRINIVVTGILESTEDEQLKSTVISILADIDVAVDVSDNKDYLHFVKVNSKSQLGKTISRLINQRILKKCTSHRQNTSQSR